MGLITFEVHMQSQQTYQNGYSIVSPFPGCRFNGEDRRWEWSCQYVISVVELSRALGHPITIHPLRSALGDLDVLEVQDEEAE